MATRRPKDAQPDEADTLRLPIEELSRRSGFTVRNIREFFRRKLIAGPRLEGRKGYYDRNHLTRLALIRRMQDRGYTLPALADLLHGWEQGGGIDDVLGMGRDLVASDEPPPGRLAQADLWALLPELRENKALRERACDVELIVKEGTKFAAPSAELARYVRFFIDAGTSLPDILDDFAELHADAERIMARSRSKFVARYVAGKADLTDLSQVRELTTRVAELRPALVRVITLLLEQAAQRGAPLPATRPSATKSKSLRPPKRR